jgi:hypothetical protein
MRPALVLLLLCAGCGGTSTVTTTRSVSAEPTRGVMPKCVALAGGSNYAYDVCDRKTIRFFGKPLNVPRPAGAGPVGGWTGGYVSQNAKLLLMQWSAECEVPFGYFVPVGGGVPRLVTGERSMAEAPESIADGWTVDGRAIVELPRGACGKNASAPGIYFITPSGKRTLIQRLPAQA